MSPDLWVLRAQNRLFDDTRQDFESWLVTRDDLYTATMSTKWTLRLRPPKVQRLHIQVHPRQHPIRPESVGRYDVKSCFLPPNYSAPSSQDPTVHSDSSTNSEIHLRQSTGPVQRCLGGRRRRRRRWATATASQGAPPTPGSACAWGKTRSKYTWC